MKEEKEEEGRKKKVISVCDGMLLFSILIGCVNVSLDRDQNG